MNRSMSIPKSTTGNTCRIFIYDANLRDSAIWGLASNQHPGTDSRSLYLYFTSGVRCTTLLTDNGRATTKMGDVADPWQSTPHSTQYYHSVATFFDNGGVKTVHLASPRKYTLTYSLDGEGRWDSLVDGSQTLVAGPTNNTMFDPAGQTLHVNLTGTTPDNDTYTYDSNTRLMNGFTFPVRNTPKTLTGTLTWNGNRTLQKLVTVDGFNTGGSITCPDTARRHHTADAVRLRQWQLGSEFHLQHRDRRHRRKIRQPDESDYLRSHRNHLESRLFLHDEPLHGLHIRQQRQRRWRRQQRVGMGRVQQNEVDRTEWNALLGDSGTCITTTHSDAWSSLRMGRPGSSGGIRRQAVSYRCRCCG